MSDLSSTHKEFNPDNLNPQKLHAVFNNNFPRYNMQISIDLRYEEVLEIYNDVFNLSSC